MTRVGLLAVVVVTSRVAGAQELEPLSNLPAPVAEPTAAEPARDVEPVAESPQTPEECAASCIESHPSCVGVDLTVRSEAAYTCRATCLVACDGAPSEGESEPAEPPPPPIIPPRAPAPAPTVAGCSDEAALAAYAASSWADIALPEPPTFDEDTLAHGSSFRMVAGSLDINGVTADNDVDDEALVLGLNVDTRYFVGHEAITYGYSVEVEAADNLTRTPAGDSSLITNALNLGVVPEVRIYPAGGLPLFLHLSADSQVIARTFQGEGDSETVVPGHVGVVFGVGAGRVLNIDPVVRLRRLEAALDSQSLLDGAIGEATGTDIIGTWYALRNEIGTYPLLATTMKHLELAGLLRTAPDLRSVYQAQQVLADPFIVDRRRGWDVRIGAGVMQAFQWSDDMDEPDPTLAILASGQLEYPIDTEQQLSVRGKVLVELGDTQEAWRPWSARLFGAFTRVFYSDTFDPTGSLTAAVETGVTGRRVPFDDPDAGIDLTGTLAYSRLLNRGSFATVAVDLLARNDGVLTLSLNLGITWGVASGFFTSYSGVVF